MLARRRGSGRRHHRRRHYSGWRRNWHDYQQNSRGTWRQLETIRRDSNSESANCRSNSSAQPRYPVTHQSVYRTHTHTFNGPFSVSLPLYFILFFPLFLLFLLPPHLGWLGSRVVSVLDSGAEGPGFKSQSRRCRVTVVGKLFTSIVPLFTKQRNW